ncbi:hypothetical protein ACWCQ1_50045 [Streptomyces sp. NPDC002144]
MRIGDEVIVYPVTAAYADYVTAPATSILAKPAGLGWAEAGSLLLSGTTAFHALHATGVGAGDTMLIHGGAVGVGLMGVQLAAAAGATVSPSRHTRLSQPLASTSTGKSAMSGCRSSSRQHTKSTESSRHTRRGFSPRPSPLG